MNALPSRIVADAPGVAAVILAMLAVPRLSLPENARAASAGSRHLAASRGLGVGAAGA